VAYLGFGKGGPWRAHRERAYNGGLGAEPPAGSRGRAPGQRVRGQSPPPWNWNTFCFWTFSGSRKFAHFFWNLETQKITDICVVFCLSLTHTKPGRLSH